MALSSTQYEYRWGLKCNVNEYSNYSFCKTWCQCIPTHMFHWHLDWLSVWTSSAVSGFLLHMTHSQKKCPWFPSSSLPPFFPSGVRRLQWALPHRGQREGRVRGVCRQLGHKPAHLHDLPHNHRCVINTNCRSALHLNKPLMARQTHAGLAAQLAVVSQLCGRTKTNEKNGVHLARSL